jgi:hypothetical protein
MANSEAVENDQLSTACKELPSMPRSSGLTWTL